VIYIFLFCLTQNIFRSLKLMLAAAFRGVAPQKAGETGEEIPWKK